MNGIVDFVRYKRGIAGLAELERAYGKRLEFKDEINYPDEEFRSFAFAAHRIMGYNDPLLCQRHFGKAIFKMLAEKYPDLLGRYGDAYIFMKNVEKVHASIPPVNIGKKIRVVDYDDAERWVKIVYSSPNKLDGFFDQLIREASNYYGEKVDITYLSKMTDGSESTIAIVKFLEK